MIKKSYFNIFILILTSIVFGNVFASSEAMQDSFDQVDKFIIRNDIRSYDREINQIVTKAKDKYFSATVFKRVIEKNKLNYDLREAIKKSIAHPYTIIPNKKVTIVVNMGLGWDSDNYQNQPYYVKNFIDEIKTLGPEVIFLSRYPYAPVEQNIATIKPQLKILLENNNVILLSLCKGSPELLVAVSELKRENPNLENKILGYLNLSGMMAGTFYSNPRSDIMLFTELESLWDQYAPTKDSFTKFDRKQTFWSLPFMTKEEITSNVNSVLDVRFENVPVINVSGIMTSDRIEQRDSPLKMFISYNKLTSIYPYATDGFLDISETRLPRRIFPHQKTLLLESSHLLADGYFDDLDLMIKENRIKFYQALYKALLLDIAKIKN